MIVYSLLFSTRNQYALNQTPMPTLLEDEISSECSALEISSPHHGHRSTSFWTFFHFSPYSENNQRYYPQQPRAPPAKLSSHTSCDNDTDIASVSLSKSTKCRGSCRLRIQRSYVPDSRTVQQHSVIKLITRRTVLIPRQDGALTIYGLRYCI